MSHEPFQNALAHLMQDAPDGEAIRRFADKHPDRWIKSVETMAVLAGYQIEE